MEALFTIENLTALITLTAMEIVLGIDNIIFIAILVSRIEKKLQAKARTIGLMLALIFRIILLFSLKWIMGLTTALFTFLEHDVTGRDLILILGGLFLITKSTSEIHHKMAEATHPETKEEDKKSVKKSSFSFAIIQIMLVDIVFSLDSVITAIGMAQSLAIMIVAVIVSMFIMLWLSDPISHFVEHNPTIKILALSFLILIGVMLTAEGMGEHVSKGYIYFAMAFSLVVELLNIRYRKKIENKP
jgi:predicted tellurium resistance membrane protein TerC